MAGGLFELRKDDITGWWVAVVVDREFEPHRFRCPHSDRSPAPDAPCQNCDRATGGRRPGADAQAACVHHRRQRRVTRRLSGRRTGSPVSGLVGDVGSWQTIVAPRGHHGAPRRGAAGRGRDARARAGRDRRRPRRDETELPPGGPELGRPGGRPHRPPLPRLLRPAPDPPPRRRGAGRRGALPDPRGHLPVLPAGPRRGRAARPAGLRGRRHRSASRRTRRARPSSCGWCRATTRRTSAGPPTTSSPAPARRSRRSSACWHTLDGPPYNLVLHTAPLHERVDETYHWHWEIHPRLREIAGLELGTGLPVNPVSPEEAVEELLGEARSGVLHSPRPRASPQAGEAGMTSRGRADEECREAARSRGRRHSGAARPSQRPDACRIPQWRVQRSLAPESPTGTASHDPGPGRRPGLHRGAVRGAPCRDLQLPEPDAARRRSRRRPRPGDLRQGLPGLRHARGPRAGAAVALPDRGAHRPGRAAPQRIVRFVPWTGDPRGHGRVRRGGWCSAAA